MALEVSLPALRSFGQYPDVPLADARDRLAAARRLLASGVDPMEQRKAERAAYSDSFKAVVKVVKAVEARGIGETARRVFEVISQIFRYAIAHGLAKRNPAADIKPADALKPFKSRNLARIDASALPGLLRSIEVYRGKVLNPARNEAHGADVPAYSRDDRRALDGD